LPIRLSCSLLCESTPDFTQLLKLTISSHRATSIPPTARMQRLEAFIAPVKQLWQNPGLDEALSSFNSFCELLGIGKVRNYLVSHRVHEVSDWSTMPLDGEGQAMQAELNERVKVILFATGTDANPQY
jgi:exportin-5